MIFTGGGTPYLLGIDPVSFGNRDPVSFGNTKPLFEGGNNSPKTRKNRINSSFLAYKKKNFGRQKRRILSGFLKSRIYLYVIVPDKPAQLDSGGHCLLCSCKKRGGPGNLFFYWIHYGADQKGAQHAQQGSGQDETEIYSN